MSRAEEENDVIHGRVSLIDTGHCELMCINGETEKTGITSVLHGIIHKTGFVGVGVVCGFVVIVC